MSKHIALYHQVQRKALNVACNSSCQWTLQQLRRVQLVMSGIPMNNFCYFSLPIYFRQFYAPKYLGQFGLVHFLFQHNFMSESRERLIKAWMDWICREAAWITLSNKIKCSDFVSEYCELDICVCLNSQICFWKNDENFSYTLSWTF